MRIRWRRKSGSNARPERRNARPNSRKRGRKRVPHRTPPGKKARWRSCGGRLRRRKPRRLRSRRSTWSGSRGAEASHPRTTSTTLREGAEAAVARTETRRTGTTPLNSTGTRETNRSPTPSFTRASSQRRRWRSRLTKPPNTSPRRGMPRSQSRPQPRPFSARTQAGGTKRPKTRWVWRATRCRPPLDRGSIRRRVAAPTLPRAWPSRTRAAGA
mmetsp:Transcript_41548/g.98491  ORF Transcript_41548/g.98491 Transcript_41548/m.98491 type:complete len:214 (+) Transcript_41548:3313-3954(+)